jgi:hypothetical protein
MDRQRGNLGILAANLTLFVIATTASAQQPGTPPPPYSPYLNLTRPGNLANNYYGLVRPEIQFRNSIQGLQTQYGNLRQDIADVNTPQGPGQFRATGHPTLFMNYSHFYSLRGRSQGSGQTPTPGGPSPRR